MPKTCQHTNCNNPVFSKMLCVNHWRSSEFNKPITRKRSDKPLYSTKTIKAVSTRQQRLNAAYSAQRLIYLKNHRICEAALTNCTFEATQAHHKRGRLEYLLDEGTWLPVCQSCHTWINEHNEAATIMGFCQSRLSKTT